MAVDGTSIKTDIDKELAGKGYRGVRVSMVISALKKTIDWVTAAVNGNLTTWLRNSDNQPGGSHTDEVYRAGRTNLYGTTYFRSQTPTALNLASMPFNQFTPVHIMGLNGSAPFIEFHIPGNQMAHLGFDTDGVFKVHPWSSSQSYPLVIDRFTRAFALNSETLNKKLALYDTDNNEHQFYGFGVNPFTLRYQVQSLTASHVFYAGASPVTSNELMRIQGDGRVGIGTTPTSNTQLDLAGGWATFRGNIGGKNPGSGYGISLGWNYSTGLAENNVVFGIQNFPTSFLSFSAWDGVTMSEKMRIMAGGNVGIGTTNPTARLHLKADGHDQLRLENAYSPNGGNDANGAPGTIAWDANFLYVKTANGVWKRTALSSF